MDAYESSSSSGRKSSVLTLTTNCLAQARRIRFQPTAWERDGGYSAQAGQRLCLDADGSPSGLGSGGKCPQSLPEEPPKGAQSTWQGLGGAARTGKGDPT